MYFTISLSYGGLIYQSSNQSYHKRRLNCASTKNNAIKLLNCGYDMDELV